MIGDETRTRNFIGLMFAWLFAGLVVTGAVYAVIKDKYISFLALVLWLLILGIKHYLGGKK